MYRSRLLLLALALLLIAPAAAVAKPAPILYATTAKSATLVKAGTSYRLALPRTSRVVGFSDRPSRTASTGSLIDVARVWAGSGFAEDPPNAALVLTGGGATRTHVVELGTPRITTTTVSFPVRRILGASEAGRADRDALVPGRYARAELFIDDTAYIPCSMDSTFYQGMVLAGPVSCLMAPGQSVVTAMPLSGLSMVACVETAGTAELGLHYQMVRLPPDTLIAQSWWLRASISSPCPTPQALADSVLNTPFVFSYTGTSGPVALVTLQGP